MKLSQRHKMKGTAFRLSGFPAALGNRTDKTPHHWHLYGHALNGRFQNRAPLHSRFVPLRFLKRPFSAGGKMQIDLMTMTSLAAQSGETFLKNDWKHNKSSDRVSPPPAEKRIQSQTAKQNGCEIATDCALS
jgi:hypothetical protein